MMSKKTFSKLSAAILLLLTISTPAGAQEISVEAARQAAASFLKSHAAKLPAKSRKGMMKAPPKAESLQLVYTQEDQLHESPALYVFEQPKQGGFVIASADERVVPIFGYFEEGNFQDAVKESCCFKAVLENFGQQIAYARENGIPQFTSTINDDNDFSPIEPITRDGVSWDQGQGGGCLNDYCPIDKNTGERCVTGCTANTMGILMYHHQWPERGVGSHSYQWRDTTLTANFGETTYQYELMGPDESLETALLLYHCGVAVNMDYSSSGSGGYIHSNNAMESFFRYNYVKEITGGDYTKVSEIHDALSHNNPLYANDSDHAFLIDGYQPGGFIHLNLHSGFVNGYVHISGLKNDYGGGRVRLGRVAPSFRIDLFVPEKDVKTIARDEIEYEILFNKATITKGTGTGDFVIPSTVNDGNGVTYPVTSIGESAFRVCTGLTSVTIPNSVTSIGDLAFNNCTGLTSVTIPNSVKSIGDWAFSYCPGLTSVTIPNSVTSIGSKAFYNTGIYNNSADGVFYVDKWACGYKGTMPANTNLVIREGTLGIADNAFSNCSGLMSVTIGNSVTSIGGYAFYSCSGLTGVTIPNSVTSIGSSAFSRCTGLTSVTFHCKEIGPWFRGITTIKEIIFGEEVTSIGANAFSECSGLTSVAIPNTVTSIGVSAFYGCSGLKKVIVKDIAAWCGIEFDFANNPLEYAQHLYSDENTEITDLVIPDGVTSISARAFYGCSGLASVTIPSSVKSIGHQAFYNRGALTSVVSEIVFPFHLDYSVFPRNNETLYVPGGTSELYKSYGWGDHFKEIVEREENKAETITQEGITYVVYRGEAQVVSVSGNPIDVVIPASISNEKGERFSVINIAPNAFSNLYRTSSITIPHTVTTIVGDLFSNYSLTAINVEEGNTAYSSIDGVLFNKDQTELIRYPRGKQGAYVIPNSVRNIGDNAFKSCNLTNVTIPNSVESIGREAFYCCYGLTSVTLPSSLTSMRAYVFSYCRNITSVVSHIEIPFRHSWAFYGMNNQATLYVPVGTIEKYKALIEWDEYFKEIVEFDINGIEGVTVSNSKSSNSENAPMYNLSDQRVGKNYKGIVIKNGKKMIVK